MFSKIFGKDEDDDFVVPDIPGDPNIMYHMPGEHEEHEGTWLQWPHNFGKSSYDRNRNRLERYEESWIQMVKALHIGERVHIIVYNEDELKRVEFILTHRGGIDMEQIDFYPWPTNDVWVRDNGPIFVFDDNDELRITDWGFNGWGNKADYDYCNQIPLRVSKELDLPITTIPLINEGGSVEIDGNGTLMAKRSSILNKNRNKGWKQEDVELYFTRYLGVTNFIWLDGTKGVDVTDDHIDGTARFANSDTIVTFYREDFLDKREYDILVEATNADDEPYNIVHLPTTKHKVVKGDYGFYINYYIGNEVILMPSFDDPNDDVALEKLQTVYPSKEIVKIPMKEVLKDGGMVHCVTQQQPAA